MLTVLYMQGDHTETIAEYENVTAEIVDGYRIVYANNQTSQTQFGPIIPTAESKPNVVCPTVYVMNGNGTTVQTYKL